MWKRQSIKQIILDLSLKITGTAFNGDAAFYISKEVDWKDDLGLDSIELMGLAAAVNSFFNLFEVSNPPYLLSSGKVDDWVEMVLTTRQRLDESLNFHTSGTSGTTKIIRHGIAFLQREIAFLADLFPDASCIVPYVPSYTIYGFLLTVGLTNRLQIPLRYPSEVDWMQLPSDALIVATPFNWQLLMDSQPHTSINCLGVSAAAPLHSALYENLTLKGIQLTELYGATETSGVAYRQHARDAFRLFPYWELRPDRGIKDRDSGRTYDLMDDIDAVGADHFHITGRKDKQIKVAGHLVNLDQVASAIRAVANVRECSISAKAIGGEPIIQASLSLYVDNDQERFNVKKTIRHLLPAHELPRNIYFSNAP